MTDAVELVDRLCRAVNEHDLDAVVRLFSGGYRCEVPAHPARGFAGSEQVRANWHRIISGVPDIAARVSSLPGVDGTVWTEWEMSGTRRDGVAQCLRGVIIFGTDDDLFSWSRFYLEPLDADGATVDAAVAKVAGEAR